MTAIHNPGAPDGRNSWEGEPTTGAALLREAAQTLREKAEAAQIGPGSWYDAHDLAEALAPQADIGTDLDADGEFIALMDPTVALAVADWLEGEAIVLDAAGDFASLVGLEIKHDSGNVGRVEIGHDADGNQKLRARSDSFALAVARAVLRREP